MSLSHLSLLFFTLHCCLHHRLNTNFFAQATKQVNIDTLKVENFTLMFLSEVLSIVSVLFIHFCNQIFTFKFSKIFVHDGCSVSHFEKNVIVTSPRIAGDYRLTPTSQIAGNALVHRLKIYTNLLYV